VPACLADTQNSTVRPGVAAPTNPPLLEIASTTASQVVLSWPLASAGFVLETSGALPAGAGWVPLSNDVAIVGRNFARTNNLGPTNSFYRLHKH